MLMKWVWDADVVEDGEGDCQVDGGGGGGGATTKERGGTMPAEGWEERVGTAATAVLYEVCRVQRLSVGELCE